MLDDVALTEEPMRLIKELSCNAEWALKLQRDALVTVFDEMDDAYLRTRKDDVDYVVSRIQRVLLNQTPLQHEKPDQRLTRRKIRHWWQPLTGPLERADNTSLYVMIRDYLPVQLGFSNPNSAESWISPLTW